MIYRYLFWRWLAPKMPSRKLRDWAWGRKWRLWFTLFGDHVPLWSAE